ncbi:MAG: DNA alkylation repair protein, partial [Acidimicrobiales bacterium]|nr:DNA alkylation repair protein [Acidimicrobiales bacterium]
MTTARRRVTSWSQAFVPAVVDGLAAAAVPGDAGPMAAYMRDQFCFLGVKAPAQKAVFRAALAAAGPPVDEAEVVTAIDDLWARAAQGAGRSSRPPREHRYAGCL